MTIDEAKAMIASAEAEMDAEYARTVHSGMDEFVLCSAGWHTDSYFPRLLMLAMLSRDHMPTQQAIATSFLHFGIRLGRKLAEVKQLEGLIGLEKESE